VIISHKYKFIFIKSLKTAGTSIEVYLSQYCGEHDVLTEIIPYVEPHQPRNHDGYYNHMPANEIRQRVGLNIWNSYFKFCVERNPWDKVLSYYFMQKVRKDNDMVFEKYLTENDWPINFPKYTENDNGVLNIVVDKVIFYESLLEGLSEVFGKLGVPFEGSLGVNAKSEYRTDRRPYQEVYTNDQANIIRNIFKEEILLHNYRF